MKIGCLFGAVIKDEYLEAIRAAGFEDVRVVDETAFPIELIANDPTAKGIMDNLEIGLNEAREIGSSIVSLKVSAIKHLRKLKKNIKTLNN